MNLAASSLFIFLLVSPGIIARRLYYTRELSRNFVSRNTLQEIFSSILLAAILHFVWIQVAEYRGYPEIDFGLIIDMLFRPDKINNLPGITNCTREISHYFISLSVASAILGILAKKIVRNFALDRKSWSEFLRYDNKWYYLITAEILDIPKMNLKRGTNPNFISKNIGERIVQIALKSDISTIYTGTIMDYQLADNNSMEYIVLADTEINKSYILANDKGEPILDPSNNLQFTLVVERPINSDYFVIPYTDVLNISFKYDTSNELIEKNLVYSRYKKVAFFIFLLAVVYLLVS